MLTVHKFPFNIEDKVDIPMPAGAEILDVQVQRGQPCVWALVDTDEPLVGTREFRVFGTGHPISGRGTEHMRHVASFQLQGGALVFHMFEIGDEETP